jgi:hypothetical protein
VEKKTQPKLKITVHVDASMVRYMRRMVGERGMGDLITRLALEYKARQDAGPRKDKRRYH